MSAELHSAPTDRARPNVSGDLPTVFQAAPMFRRAVAGYDRFQVDSYVRWAEEELATAEREHEHLLAQHVRTRAALDEARELLTHSSGGGELLHLSRRIGGMLAAAADDAAGIRADAEADRCAAAEQAERMVTEAERVLADAEAEGELLIAEAATDAAAMHAEAGRILDEAERTAADASVEAEARLAKVREIEHRAVEDADRIREQARRDGAAARVQARDEVVRMLDTAREARRRADEAAAGLLARREQEAARRYAALVGEVEILERRRSALLPEIEPLGEPDADESVGFPEQFRRLLERFGRPRSLRTP